jgi:MFS family permease
VAFVVTVRCSNLLIQWLLFNVTTLTPMFLYGLDNTIVANIAPTIVLNFSAVPQLPWLSVGFMIGGLALAMPLSKLYAIYDAKYVYLACMVLFMAASAICGAAPDINAEIVGRVFAGAGGNGMYLGLLHLVSINTEDAERPGYLGLAGAVWGIGTVLGPILGGM